eukprot:1919272-Pleurochrysis_carterae.AAC.1
MGALDADQLSHPRHRHRVAHLRCVRICGANDRSALLAPPVSIQSIASPRLLRSLQRRRRLRCPQLCVRTKHKLRASAASLRGSALLCSPMHSCRIRRASFNVCEACKRKERPASLRVWAAFCMHVNGVSILVPFVHA